MAVEKAASGRALVLHPWIKQRADGDSARSPEARLDEAVGLTRAIGLTVAHAEVVPVGKVRPGTFLGDGAAQRFADIVEPLEIEVAVMDAALSPVQQRNLEKRWKCKVIDRTGLILEIFGERARTHEGALQVELAHLSYQRSRLVRSWTHLERQRGGAGFLGGPGETQLEIDRRIIDERIVRLKRELAEVTRTRGLHRAARRRVPYPVVALVGYTNAGKSTLFNRLTRADVFAENLLFATLDPTMRQVALPSGRQIILSDTVGFVSDLPTQLVAAFRATLEEVTEADLLLHVRDVSHPDTRAQKADVEAVLDELGIADRRDTGRLVEVLNKVDRLLAEERERLVGARDLDTIALSALTGEGTDRLLALIDERLEAAQTKRHYRVALEDGAAIAWLYEHGAVVERRDDETHADMLVALDPADAARFDRRLARGEGP